MKLSVIVCTRNRAYAITRCLDSIAQALANAAPVEAEIVVVDNASEDGTQAAVNAWAETCSFPVRVLHEPRKGLAVARNCGFHGAQGEILAFTDDDCRMDLDYVKDLLRHFAGDTAPVLRGGRVELGDPADLPITVKTENTLRRWSRTIHSARYESLGKCIVGCNMAMRRSVVEQLGDFDWQFSTKAIPAGEDTDYVFRAYLAGVTIEYVPDMIVFHHHGRKSGDDGKKIMRNYMIGLGAIYAKHIFHDYNLCRPGYWDLRLAVKEFIRGTNDFMPEINFSYKDFAGYNLLGAIRYWIARSQAATGVAKRS